MHREVTHGVQMHREVTHRALIHREVTHREMTHRALIHSEVTHRALIHREVAHRSLIHREAQTHTCRKWKKDAHHTTVIRIASDTGLHGGEGDAGYLTFECQTLNTADLLLAQASTDGVKIRKDGYKRCVEPMILALVQC